jgi:hypothetical protein
MTTFGEAHTQRNIKRNQPLKKGEFVLKTHNRGTDFLAWSYLVKALKIPIDKAHAIMVGKPQKEETAQFLSTHGYSFVCKEY